MIEAPITERARHAMQRAHEERGQVLRDVWLWLFPAESAGETPERRR